MQNLIIDGFNFSFIGAFIGFKDESDTSEIKLSKTLNVLDSMLSRLRGLFPFANVYACWDSPGGTVFRKEIDSNYKANRPSERVLSYEEIGVIQHFFTDNDIINFSIERTEGDDVVFVLCKALAEAYPSSENIVITRDKDMLQVVQAGYARAVYDPVKKKYLEIPPYSITAFKALVGDRSDNISGVKNIGEVKAKKLLSEQLVTGKLNLDEEQMLQYEKCLRLVDATRHPRFDENLQAARDFLSKLI